MNEKQPQQEPDSVILPIALVNDILNYMNEKPHKEVVNLIAAIQKNAQLIVTKPKLLAEGIKVKGPAEPIGDAIVPDEDQPKNDQCEAIN